MARRLVEKGVTYVEVSLDGWDTHANNFDTLSRRLLPELDKGMSALVADLADRRLLDTTTIVWMGEFGRTPRINQNAGRDHWPRSWSVVVGGGGMKNGQVVGATDKDGVDIVDHPIGVMDLIATLTKTMGINLATQYTTPRGRPIKVVDGGQPIKELVGLTSCVERYHHEGHLLAAGVAALPVCWHYRAIFQPATARPIPPARITGPPV